MANKFIVPDYVIKQFFSFDEIKDVRIFQGGQINDTYLVVTSYSKFILQKINEDVYSSAFAVAQNTKIVEDALTKEITYHGADSSRMVTSNILTYDGQPIAFDEDENTWKCRKYQDHIDEHIKKDSSVVLKRFGYALGFFHYSTRNIHTRTLVDTIPNFHNTLKYYQNLVDASILDKVKRHKFCKKELEFFSNYKPIYSLLTDLVDHKIVPRRVCHNSPILANFLFDKKDDKIIIYSGLDNVMKGTMLYDFGDALVKNVIDFDAHHDEDMIDYSLLRNFTRGYLDVMKDFITKEEIAHFFDAFLIMALENGIRFLTDYLNGDIYFKVKPNGEPSSIHHNLERCRKLIRLSTEIDEHKRKIIHAFNLILSEKGIDYKIK